MSKKHKGPPHEEHADETWLVPYADLLTLLLALFIVLFATAKVDQDKFIQVAHAMNVALGGNISVSSINSGGNTILSGGMGVTSGPNSTPTSLMSPAELEGAELENAKAQIEAFIKNEQLDINVEAVNTDQGLLIRVRDNAVFSSGSAYLEPAGQRFAQMVASLIVKIPQNILISGHTDNLPINTAQFPSNWELSSARAINLMKFVLQSEPTINPARLSAIGLSEYRPVDTNATPEGRSKNRRVEILIQRLYLNDGNSQKAPETIINPGEITSIKSDIPNPSY